jgi:hypothetical protein
MFPLYIKKSLTDEDPIILTYVRLDEDFSVLSTNPNECKDVLLPKWMEEIDQRVSLPLSFIKLLLRSSLPRITG